LGFLFFMMCHLVSMIRIVANFLAQQAPSGRTVEDRNGTLLGISGSALAADGAAGCLARGLSGILRPCQCRRGNFGVGRRLSTMGEDFHDNSSPVSCCPSGGIAYQDFNRSELVALAKAYKFIPPSKYWPGEIASLCAWSAISHAGNTPSGPAFYNEDTAYLNDGGFSGSDLRHIGHATNEGLHSLDN